MSVDKTKSVFLMDSLEVIDRSPEAEQEGRYLHQLAGEGWRYGLAQIPGRPVSYPVPM